MAVDSTIQDLEPVKQVLDDDNLVLEQRGKAHKLSGRSLIRYLITACDKMGLLGLHVGSSRPTETQNAWIEMVDYEKLEDSAFAPFDARYERKTASLKIDDTSINATNAWSSEKIYDVIAETTCPPFAIGPAPAVTCAPAVISGRPVPIKVVSEIAVQQERPGETGTTDNPNPILSTSKATFYRRGQNTLGGLVVGPKPNGLTVDIAGNTLHIHGKITDKYAIIAKASSFLGVQPNTRVALSVDTKLPCALSLYTTGTPKRIALIEEGSITGSGIVPESLTGAVLSLERATTGQPFDVTFTVWTNFDAAAPYTPYTGAAVFHASFPPVCSGRLDWNNKELQKGVMLNFHGADVQPRSSSWAVIGAANPALKPGKTYQVLAISFAAITEISRIETTGAGVPYLFIDKKTVPWKSEQDGKAFFDSSAVATVAVETNDIISVTADTPLAGTEPGVKNFYSDTGNTTVSGRSDPLAVIEAKNERIATLENGGVK